MLLEFFFILTLIEGYQLTIWIEEWFLDHKLSFLLYSNLSYWQLI